MVIKLKDGGVIGFTTDRSYNGGCPTCHYNEMYEHFFEIEMTKGKASITVEESTEYNLCLGEFIQILTTNIESIQKQTEQEFIDWLWDQIRVKNPYKTEYGRYISVKGELKMPDGGIQT